ncbi:hypothetical protein HDU76_006391, partial [Blyttiomyces sp. JEL0837]
VSKYFLDISKTSVVRGQWLLNRYGKKSAFEGALRWTKLLDVATFEYLLKHVDKVPRYVIQRAHIRFQATNRPDLIIPLFNYGIKAWADLQLARMDTQVFRDLSHSSGYLSSMTSQVDTDRVEKMKDLVNNYGFDVNFCKFSPSTGMPDLAVNEGFRHLLNAITCGNEAFVKALLSFKIATHVPVTRDPTPITRGVSTIGWYTSDQPALSYFNNDLRNFLTHTVDALVLAVRCKGTEIVRMLLDADVERWETTHGQEVLQKALQLAVDENFTAGVRMITMYLGNITPPKRSASALRKHLIDACVTGKLEDVKALVEEGALFDSVESFFSHYQKRIDPVKHVIQSDNDRMLDYLLDHYPFDSEKLGEMLITTIEYGMPHLALMILADKRKKRPFITVKTLSKCMNMHLSEIMATELLRASPGKRVYAFPRFFRQAQGKHAKGNISDEVFQCLADYNKVFEDKVKKDVTKNGSGSRGKKTTNGKGKGKAVATTSKGKRRRSAFYDFEDEEDEDDEDQDEDDEDNVESDVDEGDGNEDEEVATGGKRKGVMENEGERGTKRVKVDRKGKGVAVNGDANGEAAASSLCAKPFTTRSGRVSQKVARFV